MDGIKLIGLSLRPSPFSVSEEGKIMQKQLWEESMEEMRKVDPSTASMISTLV